MDVDWVCDRLREDPTIPSQRLRELAVDLGYEAARRSLITMCGRSGPRLLAEQGCAR